MQFFGFSSVALALLHGTAIVYADVNSVLSAADAAPAGATLSPTVYTSSGTVQKVSNGWQITNGASGSSQITFDYLVAVGGMPFITTSSVKSTAAAVDIELFFSETIAGMNTTTGDGPFFLFSNAMDSYRAIPQTLVPSTKTQTLNLQFPQRSLRYLRVVLNTPNSSIIISNIGFTVIRATNPTVSSFSCSNAALNKIWLDGVRTVDKCVVEAGESPVAWQVMANGTRVRGQHWSPVRQGTYWADITSSFEVAVENKGASWGTHMVANGLVFVLNTATRTLAAFTGYADVSGVFPTTNVGNWTIPESVSLTGWISVNTTATGATASCSINDVLIASITGLDISPTLGESADNTGSVTFGGPQGYSAIYRNLEVVDADLGTVLYTNTMMTADSARTLADFGTGTNALASTVDGAKRDRAVFGGDLFILGRSIAYSTNTLNAVKGAITLLASHQNSAGYLGNLSPVQTPAQLATETFEPPTSSFYSVSYALLLIVAIRDYWLYSGDSATVVSLFPKFVKMAAYMETYLNTETGLIEASIPESLDFYPGGGPVFGASAKINLAYYDALNAMGNMSATAKVTDTFTSRAATLKTALVNNLYNSAAGIMPMSNYVENTGVDQCVNAYSVTLGVTPINSYTESLLSAPADGSLPLAWSGISTWDFDLTSPLTSGFAVEGLFVRNFGPQAIELVERVWGVMSNEASPNYSGGHWEAISQSESTPLTYDTSLHHGWSTAPVSLLPKYLAGLAPLQPGWTRFLVKPVLAGLTYVNCTLSTVAGTIKVNLKITESVGTGQIILTAPAGSTAEVHSPVGWSFLSVGFPTVKNVTGTGASTTLTIYKVSTPDEPDEPDECES